MINFLEAALAKGKHIWPLKTVCVRGGGGSTTTLLQHLVQIQKMAGGDRGEQAMRAPTAAPKAPPPS